MEIQGLVVPGWYGYAAVLAVLAVVFLHSRRRISQGRAVSHWFALMTIGFFLGMGLCLVSARSAWLGPNSRGMAPEVPRSEIAH